MIATTEELIQEMTRKIVEAVEPQMVVLFGSRARGTARADSDFDFLVVEDGPFGPERSRRAEMVKLWRLLRDFRVAKDFLVYTPAEVERWKGAPNHVVAHALREGRVLYERH
jgi:predicted nucleotidyltransferase